MILPRYESAFRSLTQSELDRIMSAMAVRHPELRELEDMDGQTLLEYCRASSISQAEVIMSLARDAHPDAVTAVERLCMRPIDRRSPAEVERERHAASPPPVVAPVSQTTVGSDLRVIRLLAASNPKRAGTASHARFARYRDGMTVADFIRAGGTRGDVTWDQEKGHIRLDPEGTVVD